MAGNVWRRKPRNLLILFYEHDGGQWISPEVIEGDVGSREQLSHRQAILPPRLSIASRWKQLIGLRPTRPALSLEGSNVVRVVERAYRFVVRHYAPGDQVIISFVATFYFDIVLRAVGMLATCLTDGTLSSLPHVSRSANEKGFIGPKIHVKGVVAGYHSYSGGPVLDASELSDQLLSSTPLSVEHLIVWALPRDDAAFSCWTKRSPIGQIISKEYCFYDGVAWINGISIHASKHLIHYEPDRIPDWDKETPIWTHPYMSDSEQPPRGGQYQQYRSSLEKQDPTRERNESQPIGMYRHELSLYRWTDQTQDDGTQSCLVWKSSYN